MWQCDTQRKVPTNLLYFLQFRSFHVLTFLARQVLAQSSSSSRARRKRVMNVTMFDVPDHPYDMSVPITVTARYKTQHIY
jgi:hypothetical protein